MEVRQKINLALIFFMTFVAFASYHEGTGSTAWLQYATVVIMLVFGYFFDVAFTNESDFIFDPDADNWRRKTEAGAM